MKHFSTLLAFGALAACAATDANTTAETGAEAETAGRDCFNVRSVNGFTEVDRDTVRLNVTGRRVYEVDVIGAQCTHLNWSHAMSVRATSGSFLCVGDRLNAGEIVTDQGDVCRITDIRRVVEEDDEGANGESADETTAS